MRDVASIELPAWAKVSARRREHIVRVTALVEEWAVAMEIDEETAREWHDAARWHDALRDAPEPELREMLGDTTTLGPLLHGPAAALRLEREGEPRAGVLSAIAHHTVGCVGWGSTGRALYMADYLEPGRAFAREARASLAAAVPADFDGVFRDVVRQRLEWGIREGLEPHSQTVDLWNAVR